MITAFRATDQTERTRKPEGDTKITLSDFAISTDGPIGTGSHTFEVVNNLSYDSGLQLVRLGDNQSLEDVIDWFSHGQNNPSPVDFLGGIRGKTSIFQTTLQPGHYAFVLPGFPEDVDEEFTIPEDGAAPAITDKPVNPPVNMTVPNGDSVVTLSPGRTLITLTNQGDSRATYLIFRRTPELTDAQFLDIVQPAGLNQKISKDSLGIPIPIVGLPPKADRQVNLDLQKGVYFLVPFIRKHMAGARALTAEEMDIIKKLEVR